MIERATLVSLLAVSTAVSTPTSVAAQPGKPPAGKPAPAPAPGARMAPDDLPGPPPEVAGETARVDLPAIPAFALPAVEPGCHGPRELHVQGRHLLGTEVKVRGYITGIYDCAAQLASPDARPDRAQALTRCDVMEFTARDHDATCRDRTAARRRLRAAVHDRPRP